MNATVVTAPKALLTSIANPELFHTPSPAMVVDWLSALWPAVLLVAWYLYSALLVSLTFTRLQRYCSILRGIQLQFQTTAHAVCWKMCLAQPPHQRLKSHLDRFYSSILTLELQQHVIDSLEAFNMFMIFISILSGYNSQSAQIYFGSKSSKEHNITWTLHKFLPCLTGLWKKCACICCLDFTGQQKLRMIYRTRSVPRFMVFLHRGKFSSFYSYEPCTKWLQDSQASEWVSIHTVGEPPFTVVILASP